ncbi:hypothetical protein N431DRAFT_423438 [Stipitochalara longipes BDJ]|nr:hypothetical protein N431DRAFT_423438 [Stipitochalara longipes BDJ]
MRLLERTRDGRLSLTRDLINNIPPYAILSHTWGVDEEEVTFQDLSNGSEQARSKVGYRKILFCGEQAARDNLQYFWVDTCCIDKSNNTELSEAINSMFRWYRDAAKCYVHLADVSAEPGENRSWELSFRRSRWFTRGWTLQELIAPHSVEFFSVEGTVLGDKVLLEQELHEITGIAVQALRGCALPDFTVTKRMAWAESRRTAREEDKAYCLLGIFDVCMPLIYGEGEKKALRRLRREIYVLESELNLPFAVEAPFNAYQRQHEPVCLANTRVDLLRQIYDWIDGPNKASIFWLSGFAGTGKSTIARTVARTYDQKRCLGASFFFVRGGGDVGSASKLFTTIATQLARGVPTLHQHIYDAVAKHKDISHQSLREQWKHLILEPLSKLKSDRHGLQSSYVLVIDALDECGDENNIRIIPQLLTEARSLEDVRLRILLTSRPEVPIRNGFLRIPDTEHQDFVLHNISPPIIDKDIQIFLEYDLRLIAQERFLGPEWPSDEAVRCLVQRASGLFIWAATVCRFIRQGRQFAPKRLDTIVSSSASSANAPEKHLNQIYITVLKQSISDEYTSEEREELCSLLREILGSIILLLSPLTLHSLSKLLCITSEDIAQSVADLHSVLDIPKNPAQLLRIHHPSFRDFLLDKERCTDRNFWVNDKEAHQALTGHCIRLMSSSLKQDICAVKKPGTLVADVESGRIKRCLPMELQYACLYWTHHLQKSDTQLLDNDKVHRFLKEHLLHWFEALAWMGKLSEGVYMISSLEGLTTERECSEIAKFTYDAKRFILYNRSGTEQAPLQTYCSALVFAPIMSTVRKQFEDRIPRLIHKLPKVDLYWNAIVQTLEGHTAAVECVAFSEDGLLASVSLDWTIKLWDLNSGALLHTLESSSYFGNTIAFSGGLLALANSRGTVELWDARRGALLHKHKVRRRRERSKRNVVTISNGLLASGSGSGSITIWDIRSGALLHTFRSHSNPIRYLALSPAGLLASQSRYNIELWNTSSGELLKKFYCQSDIPPVLSPDGKLLAWVDSRDNFYLKVWSNSLAALKTLWGHSNIINAIAFSQNNRLLASASTDWTIKLWDPSSGTELASLYDASIRSIRNIAFSTNGKLLASANKNCDVQLWDPSLGAELRQTLEGHSDEIKTAALSADAFVFVSGSLDCAIKIWSIKSGAVLQILEGHSKGIVEVAISPDGKLVASAARDYTIKLWDTHSGLVLRTLIGHISFVTRLTFSPDGSLLASRVYDSVKLWKTVSGELLWTFEGRSKYSSGLSSSSDGKLVAMQNCDKDVKLLDANSGDLVQTFQLPDKGHKILFSADSSVSQTNGQPQSVISSNGADIPSLKSGRSVSIDHDWVCWGTEKILWLPPEYRPTRFYVHEGNLALCLASKRVVFIEFAFDD